MSPPKKKGKSVAKPTDSQALEEWWSARMKEVERAHERRVMLLKTVGEHPSPIFAYQVKLFGGLGMPLYLVAKLLDIDERELMLHYANEYDLGKAEIMGSVAMNMIRIGTSNGRDAGKVGMEILSRRGGMEWKPAAQKIELDDNREKPANVIDSSKLTFEQRQELKAMIEYATSGAKGEPKQLGEDDQPIEEGEDQSCGL